MLVGLLYLVHWTSPSAAIRLARLYWKLTLLIDDDCRAENSHLMRAVREFNHNPRMNHFICPLPYCRKPVIRSLEKDHYHAACAAEIRASDELHLAIMRDELDSLSHEGH